jgi:hypothetical protein
MTHPTYLPDSVTLHVPFHIRKRGGRKQVILPESSNAQRRPDNTLLKSVARAFRWKRLLDDGKFATAAELATHERISPSYVTRIMRLTLLAPDIIDAILNGHASDLCIDDITKPMTPIWAEQREMLGYK